MEISPVANSETTVTRAPRGTKPVSQAFFVALDAIPEATRAAVAKAAQVMIRDELKARREKIKAIAAKEKARRPHATKRAAKPEVTKVEAATSAAEPPKKGSRKPMSVSTTS